MKNNKEDIFNSGAAGYILSRRTMERMVAEWDSKHENCWIGSDAGAWLQENPGLVTLKCLQHLQIKAIDTRSKNKWHRFHAFPLTRLVAGKVDQWYLNKHQGLGPSLGGFDESYAEVLMGQDCCSADTVSFHYVEYKECRALFTIRAALIANPSMNEDSLKHLFHQHWPSDSKEVGGYSRMLPDDSDTSGWADLMMVTRKISGVTSQRQC